MLSACSWTRRFYDQSSSDRFSARYRRAPLMMVNLFRLPPSARRPDSAAVTPSVCFGPDPVAGAALLEGGSAFPFVRDILLGAGPLQFLDLALCRRFSCRNRRTRPDVRCAAPLSGDQCPLPTARRRASHTRRSGGRAKGTTASQLPAETTAGRTVRITAYVAPCCSETR